MRRLEFQSESCFVALRVYSELSPRLRSSVVVHKFVDQKVL